MAVRTKDHFTTGFIQRMMERKTLANGARRHTSACGPLEGQAMPSPTQIVVVDDDPSMRLALQRLLSAAGFTATTFASAETLLQADGAAANVHCLILDVHLPGLSGFELRRRLVESGATSPVIFITAHDEPATRAQAEQAGAIAYLIKPFPGRGLLTAVTQAVRSA